MGDLRHIVLDKLETGLITDRNQMELPIGSATATQNVVWIDGYLRSRAGFGLLYSSPAGSDRIHHIGVHQSSAGVSNIFIVTYTSGTGAATFWRHDDTTMLWTSVAVIPSPALSLSNPCTSCGFAGKSYLTIGNGELYQFDGAALVTVASLSPDPIFAPPQKPQIVVPGDSRLFLADVVRDGTRLTYRLEWSDREKQYVYGGGVGGGSSYFMDLPKNSDPITGLYTSGSDIMVFRPREVYLVSFVGTPQVYKIQASVRGPGTVAHATIKPYILGEVVWLGDDNIYQGSPTTQPRPVGDHIRNRIRQICSTSNLAKAKATLNVDTHLYTLYLPDINSTNNTRMLTLNLRNGSWWEGRIEDSSFYVTDAVGYRDTTWNTKHLVTTQEGRILEHSLAYTRDDQVEFPVSWTSGVITARNIYDPSHEQASAQSLRAMAEQTTSGGVATQVSFSLQYGNGLDRFVSVPFVNPLDGSLPQVLDGTGMVYTCERAQAENFKITAYSTSGSLFPKIAQLHFGTLPEGPTR